MILMTLMTFLTTSKRGRGILNAWTDKVIDGLEFYHVRAEKKAKQAAAKARVMA